MGSAYEPHGEPIGLPIHTQTQSHSHSQGTPFSPTEKTPAGGFPRKPGAGYAVLKAVMDALDRGGFPAPDEKLKRIVGGQINALIRGGYPLERIRHFAVELALSWDNTKGHQRLLGLRQAVLQDDATREDKAHERRTKELEGAPQDPEVRAAVLAGLRKAKAEMRRVDVMSTLDRIEASS